MGKISPYRELSDDLRPKVLWLVVYTNPNCEFLVNYDLFKRGFDTYLPLTEITRNNERRKVPFLSRYLFVKCCDEQYLLNSIPGITHIVAFGDAFATVPDNVIDNLRSRECKEYPKYIPIPKLDEKALEFLPNELIRIISGPHTGLTARFNNRKNKARAMVTSEGNQSYKLDIPLHAIVAQNNYKPINVRPAYRAY